MSKRKKTQSHNPSFSQTRRLPRALEEALIRISENIEDDDCDWDDVHEELLDLEKQWPNELPLLALLGESASVVQDFPTLERAAVRFNRLQPNVPEAVLTLIQAYIANYRPVLTFQTFERFVSQWPTHPALEKAPFNLEEMRTVVDATLVGLGYEGPTGLQLAAKNEETLSLIAIGEYAKARQLADTLLKTHPTSVIVLNNKTYAFHSEGRYQDAIAVALRALEIAPDDLHALSNLVKINVIIGQRDQAHEYAERAKVADITKSDALTKVLEILLIVNDPAAAVDIYERADETIRNDISNALLLHFAATAYAYQNRMDDAEELWIRLDELEIELPLVSENLDDLDLPPGKRHGPAAFSTQYWLGERLLDAMLDSAAQTMNLSQEAIERASRKLLRQHPEIFTLTPVMFEIGDETAVEMLLDFANISHTSEMMEPIQKFAHGSRGSDAMRIRALGIVQRAGLESSEPTSFWLRGTPEQISIPHYELYEDIDFPARDPQVEELFAEATELLQTRQPQQAEPLLKHALMLAPHDQGVRNNLASVYAIQNRIEEALEEFEKNYALHPDYVTGRCNLALRYVLRGRLPEARALLDPVVAMSRLHVSEYTLLCVAQAAYYLADKDSTHAALWEAMLETQEPEHPMINRLEELLESDDDQEDYEDAIPI